MSLIITVYTSEGIVMASDSRTTQTFTNKGKSKSFPLSDNVEKTFVTKWNYGISTCGEASINGLPLSGYIQSFLDSYEYEMTKTTVQSFANDLCNYFATLDLKSLLIFHVAGYDRNEKSFVCKVFRCIIYTDKSTNINLVSENNYGAAWDGQTEVMLRIIKQQFLSPSFIDAKHATYISNKGEAIDIDNAFIISKDSATFFPEASIDFNMMTIQDAVDFARFAVRTTIDTQRFLQMEKTVGGPIDVLVIKPQGNQWVSHKELK